MGSPDTATSKHLIGIERNKTVEEFRPEPAPPHTEHEIQSALVADVPPKRKRGRPRKVPIPVETPGERALPTFGGQSTDVEIAAMLSKFPTIDAEKEAEGNKNQENAPTKRPGREKKAHNADAVKNEAEPIDVGARSAEAEVFDTLSKKSVQRAGKSLKKEKGLEMAPSKKGGTPQDLPVPINAAKAPTPKVSGPPVVESDVYATLSKTLELHSAKLSAEEAMHEAELRPLIVKCLQDVTTDERELGQLLFEYRSVYKGGRQWTRIATQIGKLIDRSARTIYRMVDQFEASQRSEPLDEDLPDAIGIVTVKMNAGEKAEVAARLAIRSYLNEILKIEDKLNAIERLLSEEAYQVWGKRIAFSLKITPAPSRYTIDGRKKPENQAEGAAA